MSAATTAVHCRLAQDAADWPALREHWSELHAATPQATPWQSYEFLYSWWCAMAGTRRLCLCVVERAGTPVLILPLQISRVDMLGLRVRTLEPIGMPDDINRPRLALGPADGANLRCALDALWANRTQWDALRIDEHMLDDPELLTLREFAAQNFLSYRQTALHPCPYLELRQSWPEYLVSRGERLRKNLRAAQRQLRAMGEVRLVTHDSPESIPAAFDILLDVHRRSWKQGARIGLCQSQAYQEFYRQFVMAMAARRSVRILLLYCGELAVAGTIAFTDSRTYYAAQIAHDQRFARASPGTLLESLEMEQVLNDKGFAEYDFLGAALSNKLRWTDMARDTYRILLFKRTWRNRLIDHYYFALKPRLKRWREGSQREQ